ncbi:phage late control D family protein [Pseudomonas sp. Sample_24]|uniref:phage late control D family protein n=1 Tax=Pseudomonas sp. Sample_24 TaxID=2448268 RepID=UPI0010329C5C|nr:phage late control D family protein [Pseudomonas sp. Sample_24]
MIDQALNQVNAYLDRAKEAYRDATAYPRPICRVVVDGNDITAAIEARLINIELTDNRGMEADQLDVTLSDHDGMLAIPPKGAVLQVWLGWSDTGLVDKGTYTVDETEHSGAPDQLSIRARSADLRAGLKVKRERSWHGQTLKAVIEAIAGAYGLGAVVSAAFSALNLAHLDQANESDANLLSRLGLENDAIATVKAGRLLFMPIGKSTTASGLHLPHITLTRQDGDQHRFLQADRDSYTGVRAFYYEVNSAEKKEAIAGGGENLKDLRHTYTDQKSALVAARSEMSRLQRGTATLSYTLARGRPDLTPELTYSLVGIKQEISDVVWLGGNVKHSFSPDSFTTSLELESKLPDDDGVNELADNSDNYTGIVAWYRDDKTGEQKQLTEGDQSKPRRLAHLYESKSSAKRAAERENKRLQR